MENRYVDAFLPLVRQPSQYLGSEINARRKASEAVALRVLLAFPDLYEIGMAYQGLQILYQLLNTRGDIAAERAFTPGEDMAALLRRNKQPLGSLETGTPLANFDILGFSLLYELSFTNVLAMLDLSGIPFLAREREASHPILLAGGPCTFNPEPIAGIFDAIVIGDGEDTILGLADDWLKWRAGGAGRTALLKTWSRRPGVYIPSFFSPRWDEQARQRVDPLLPGYSTVHKAVVPDLDRVPPPTRPIVAFGNPIHDRLSLEISRGCTRGCRFCQAGMIYRPVRERHPEGLLGMTDEALCRSGYEEVSLLSLSAGDYGSLPWLLQRLMDQCEPERIALSLPSLRVGSLTDSLMGQIKRVRKTGFTIAPEAGSQRLRDVINKNVDERSIFEAVESAIALGWQGIKLYFMIGLPTETEADVEAIIDLAMRLGRTGKGKKGWKGLTVSVSTFIPKSHTPFQWCSQISMQESREKIGKLKAAFRERGIRFKWQNPAMSLLEGIWARGDRKLLPLLIKAYDLGCRFDGWSDAFDLSAWQAAMDATGIDADTYLRGRDVTSPLPWDHVDCGVSREFLAAEWKKAFSGNLTADCRQGTCSGCGVCDFETVKPIVYRHRPMETVDSPSPKALPPKCYKKWSISYEKTDAGRFFGHLEMVKIIARAFRRAKIPIRYSQGFHPAPKISFQTALPVGIESQEELFSVEVPPDFVPERVLAAVNRRLPDGLRLTRCRSYAERKGSADSREHHYRITVQDTLFNGDELAAFDDSSSWVVEKVNRKGRASKVDLKKLVTRMDMISPTVLEMTLNTTDSPQLPVSRILGEVFSLPERSIKLARIQKQPTGTV